MEKMNQFDVLLQNSKKQEKRVHDLANHFSTLNYLIRNQHFPEAEHYIEQLILEFLSTQEEFDQYIDTMTLKGFGGNNEIALFSYVDELVRQREFSNLKGMIYLTDGYGIFPDKKPNYEVAFVFINDRYEIPEVPPWVIRLVLQKDEI